MDGHQVERLRAALRGTAWWTRALGVGAAVRRTSAAGGLLVVGTPTDEPWHFTAHLDDEARWSGLSQLRPTLVRWEPPPGAPPHLAVGLDRLEGAGRGETVVVVAPDTAPEGLLERLADARRVGATVVSLDTGDPDLEGLAHERFVVGPSGLVLPRRLDAGATGGIETGLTVAQHLVTTAAAANDRVAAR